MTAQLAQQVVVLGRLEPRVVVGERDEVRHDAFAGDAEHSPSRPQPAITSSAISSAP